ncbi:pyridoxal phosphate-dependent aminotransferase [Granulicatella sp. 19428wC4_WM01]|uniref:pyridoxal phosphate-dependent aminotransferase n=1 Tax=unclassified Granulicatella TaxID=2630493 RepID=UPI00351C6909
MNSKVQKLQSSGIRRFFGLAASMDNVISLGVGEPDFETPWIIKEAAIQSIQKGQTFYSSNAGLLPLRQGVSDFVKRKYQLNYNPENEILMTVGGSEAIDLAMRTLIDVDDEIIVTSPNYVSYGPCIELAGGIPVYLDLKEENEFKLLPDELERSITSKTKALVITFPNNPTGAIMEKEDLEKIAEVVKKHDIFVISDEMYSELTYTSTPHYSIGAIDGMKERSIILNGFSKAFAMTGWRLGFVLAPEKVIEAMVKIHQYTIVAPATFVQYAAIQAINTCDDEIETMRLSYNQRRRFLLNKLKQMNLHCFEPRGAFYLFVNIQQFGMSSEEFCERLLHAEHLAIVPGSAFGQAGEGFVRISYAYSLEQLKEAMQRLERFVKSLV